MQADTTPDAEAVRLAALRKLSGAERLKLALELSETVRALELAGRMARAELRVSGGKASR